jgi:hypothetical protein
MRISILIILTLLVGCSSSKELTETSGRQLIQEAASKAPYNASLRGLDGISNRTQTDYRLSPGSGNGPDAVAKRMLDKGLMTVSVETLSFPRISGSFLCPPPPACVGKGDLGDKLSIENTPGTNEVSGEMVFSSCDGDQRKMPFKGMLNADGTFGMDTMFKTSAVYQEHGGTAEISFPLLNGYSSSDICRGNATGQKVQVVWYDYGLAPDFAKRIIPSADGRRFISVGTATITDVSNLRLDNETNASSTFAWEVKLSSDDEAVLGTDKLSGNGAANFAKKPDGTWTLVRWGTY